MSIHLALRVPPRLGLSSTCTVFTFPSAPGLVSSCPLPLFSLKVSSSLGYQEVEALFSPVRGGFPRVAGNTYSGGTSLRTERCFQSLLGIRGLGFRRFELHREISTAWGRTEMLKSAERSSIRRDPPNSHTVTLRGHQTHTQRFGLVQTNLLETA